MRLLRSASQFLGLSISVLISPSAAVAQVVAAPLSTARPAIRIDAAQASPDDAQLSESEKAQVISIYESLPLEERAAMREAYLEMGIDLDALLAAKGAAGGAATVVAGPALPELIARMDFTRTPQAVLSARTRLGLEYPGVGPTGPSEAGAAPTVPPGEAPAAPVAALSGAEKTAAWLHLTVMAGEWETLGAFLQSRPIAEAQAIYAHILRGTNKGDPGLLPEEVLAIGSASPGAPQEWQIETLATLLRNAAAKTATGPLLEQLRTGTRHFGGADEGERARAASLLIKAGLVIDALEFLPELEEAKQRGDAAVIYGHARYHEGRAGLARPGDDQAGDADRLTAWTLFRLVTELESAEAATRTDSLRRALALLPDVPEAQGEAWLAGLFAHPALGAAALEVIALDALTMRDRKVEESRRVQSIVTMKQAVDRLLDTPNLDLRLLRVPLRMLTIGLTTEAETAAVERTDRRGTPPETGMLLRAIPGERWLGAIEPSLALRTSRAFIGVATIADETDTALDLLAQAIARMPDQAADLADHFLALWTRRLKPRQEFDQDAAIYAAFIAFGGQNVVPAAPLTRGRQRRDLARLERVLTTLAGAGIPADRLTGVVDAFRACHSKAEVYAEEDVQRVLGAIDAMPSRTAATLARAMQSGLNGQWRDRQVHQQAGFRRSATDIALVVEAGYALALKLADRALAQAPDSWEFAMTRAALAYDRLEFKQSQQKQDFATYNEYRRLAFKAFADAADRYAQLLHAGEAKSNPEVFLLWFNAAVGASELSHLTRENITVEGSAGDDQIDRIAAAIDALPEAASFAHRAAFAEAVTGSVNALSPEVKPRVVRHALRVVRDHPSGASLRRMHELYEDLLRHEIHLRLTLDGDDRVGSLAPFGVMLSIRYTNAVARETDGFSKYLQNEVWVNFGPRSTFVNYRDKLQRGVEDALRESFDIASIAFFEPLHPSREVTEGGETGWQEKPLAYMVLKAKDASLERIPAVQMDLDFIDSSGPVILAVSSNSPPIDAGHRSARPVHDLVITQTVDVRQVGDGSKDQATLEIHASARGVVPSLDEMLTAVESALSGYAPGDSGITENPLNIAQADQDGATPYQMMVSARSASEKSYLEADADGVYRMTTERSWTITYAPQGGSTAGSAFVLPALKEGTAGKLTSRTYADMDIVEVSGPRVLIEGGSLSPLTIALLGLLLLAALLLLARALRNRAGDGNEETWADLAPHRLTPMSVLAALDRIAAQRGAAFAPDRLAALNAERVALERRCFGPGAVEVAAAELEEVARRWRQG